MRFSPEFNTLLLLSLQRMSPEEIRKVEGSLESGLDWDVFISLVKFHRLLNPVYINLNAHFQGQLPEEVSTRLKALYSKHLVKGLRNVAEVVKLAAEFKKNDIPALFLKGVCLSLLLYDDPVARYSGDIDILVSKSKLKATERALAAHGYKRFDPPICIDGPRLAIYTQIRFHAQYKSPTNTVVEIHWRFCLLNEMFPMRFDELWKQRQYVCHNGFDIPTLSIHHTLHFLSIHGSRHGWEKLFWVKDIADLYSKYSAFDWESLLVVAENKEIALFVEEELFLISSLFGVRLPYRLLSLAKNRFRVSLSVKIIYYLYVAKASPVTNLLFSFREIFIFNKRHKISFLRSKVLSRYYRIRLGIAGNVLLFRWLHRFLNRYYPIE